MAFDQEGFNNFVLDNGVVGFFEDPITLKSGRMYDLQSVQQAVEAKGVPYHALSSALTLLPEAYARLQPGEDIGRAIEAEFEEYGVEKLKLVGI
jgi:hypothetical protein